MYIIYITNMYISCAYLVLNIYMKYIYNLLVIVEIIVNITVNIDVNA